MIDMIINAHRASCTIGLPVILVRFSSNLNFLHRHSKNKQISNFKKIRPAGAELFCADRQYTDRKTDTTKLVVVSAVLRRRLIRVEQNSETCMVTAINHERSLLY
jgi:hypothetical protein